LEGTQLYPLNDIFIIAKESLEVQACQNSVLTFDSLAFFALLKHLDCDEP
jgi:hypothetical protein